MTRLARTRRHPPKGLHPLVPPAAVVLAGVLVAAAAQATRAAGTANPARPTTIRLTGHVLVAETTRLGVNLGGDTYYSGAALVKKRARENFEGTMYRQCHFGPGGDRQGLATWFRPSDTWRELITGGRYTILSGKSKWTTGTVKEVLEKQYRHNGQMEPFAYFLLDHPISQPPQGGRIGIMVERDRTGDGCFRPLDGYWTSPQNEIAVGDVPEATFGSAVLRLKGSAKAAHVLFATHYQRYGQTNGRWHVRFWAKAKAGDPKLTVAAGRDWGQSVEILPPRQWKRYEEILTVDRVPEPTGPKDNPHLLFVFTAAAGDALLDDVEIWMEGDENPTAFRDDCVATLRRYRPGVLRYLQMGGSTVANTIAPPLESFAYTSRPSAKLGPYARPNRDPWGLDEMYKLCEYLDCDPWYSLPGTLTREEMAQFLEYLGAPPEVGMGRRRAALGHPRPWTEVFHQIHVEFGNEAWNNAAAYKCGGFNGPDYWHDLIAVGKASPYYTPKIIFHAAGQAANTWLNRSLIANTPNADRFSVAPYIIQGFSRQEYSKYLDTDEKLFRWAFAWPIHRSRDPQGAMFQNAQLAQAAGQELSIYEINHHTTHGDGPLAPRNKLVTSIGGGLNVVNTMLMMLKQHHIRTQCLFSLIQHGYNARGVGEVRLWGTALSMRQGHQRYRPTFLACATANRVLGGDLVETVHEGAQPTFDASGVFSKQKGAQTLKGLPVLWSYGFAEGDRRGLILISLDTSRTLPVAIRFDGKVSGRRATGWLMTADRIGANNEFEQPRPQVEIRQRSIEGFQSGWRYEMPPFSMLAMQWQVASGQTRP